MAGEEIGEAVTVGDPECNVIQGIDLHLILTQSLARSVRRRNRSA
jgi:hypothetical protein